MSSGSFTGSWWRGWSQALIRTASLTTLLAASLAASAADVTLTASDPANVYSFNSATNWSNGQAPSAGDRYFTGAFTLRSNTSPFLGNALTIDSGGMLAVGADTRVGNLTLAGGTLASSGGARMVWSSGEQIVLTADSTLDGTAGQLTIRSPILGSGGLAIKGNVRFYNDSNNYGSYKDRWGYAGDTTILSGGTLTFSYIYPAGGPGKGNFNVNSGGSLVLFRTANVNALTGAGNVTSGTTWSLGNGDASGTLSGILSGAGTVLTKTGAGTQTFAGANTYSGGTTAKAGILELDYAAQNNSKLPDAGVITLGGGTLRLTGGNHVEAVASTALSASSASSVTRSSGTATLTLNAITRNAGATVNFGSDGIATTDTTNVNGILGGWATVGGQDWAVNSTNGADGSVVALTAYDGPLPSSGGSATANATLAGSLVLTGGVAANTVKVSNAANGDLLDLGANDLTITSSSATSLGGILYVGGQDGLYTISGSGRILPSTVGQELLFNVNAGTLTVNAAIGAASGASAVTKVGPGRMVLGAASTHTGTTTVAGGTLAYALADALGSGGVTINGGTLALGGFSDTVGAVSLTAGGITGPGTLTGSSFTFGNDSPVEVTAVLGGSAATLAKSGSGTLTLSAPNTFGGLTTVNGGTLRYGVANAIGAGNVTIHANTEGAQVAVLDMGAFSDTVGAVTVTDGDILGSGTLTASSFTLNGGTQAAATYFGSVVVAAISVNLGGSGSTTLTKSDAGVSILTGTNTYSGATTIAGGVLRADDGVGLPAASALTISGATLGSYGKYAVMETGSDLARAGGTGAGEMRITGGTSGFSANGGPVRVAFGTLAVPTPLTWGTAPFQPANLVLNSIYATDTIEFTNAIDLNGAVRTVIVDANVATMSGVLSGTGSSGLTKGLTSGNPLYDTGTLLLTAANTYTGATTVNYGALNIRHATALGTTDGGTTVASGAALEVQGGITVGAEALSLNGTGLNATGALRNVSGANEWQGAVTLAGAARINSDGGSLALSNSAGITATNLGLTLGGAANGTLSGAIATGSGGLTKDGAGMWTLGGTNTYTGQTLISGGVLRFTAAAGLPTNSRLTLGGGVIETSGNLERTGGTAAGNMDMTAGGGFSARGGAVQVAFGTLASPTALTWGTAPFNPGTGTFVLNLPTADNPVTFANAINLNGAQRTVQVGANTATITGALTGTGSSGLTKTGAGRLVLSAVNTYAGATTVDQGTLEIGALATINSTSGITINTAGRLRYDSQTALSRNVTIAGGGLFYNSANPLSGVLTFTSGTVGGTNLTGSLGGLTIAENRILSPGNSPGTAATTSQTWNSGGTYLFEVNAAAGDPGSALGWDLVTGSGTLVILADSSLPFTVKLASLTVQNASGPVSDFDPSTQYAWLMADFQNPISTFDPTSFTVDPALFTNSFTGTGQFSVALGDTVFGGDNTQLYVVYAVPEPATACLVLLGLGALAGAVRLRRVD